MASKKKGSESESGEENVSSRPQYKSTGGRGLTENSSLDEKLQWFDQEVRSLQQFCVGQGYTPWQLERSGQPLLTVVDQWKRETWMSTAAKCAGVLVVILALVYYDPAYRVVCASARLGSLKVLPYWDWTVYYEQECLLENPYFEANHLSQEDCEVCENLDTIDRVSNISHSVMAEDFLKRDIPVIVTDGMDNWLSTNDFSVNFLYQLYSTEDTLKDVMPCMFASNVRVKFGSARSLLARASKGDISNWYAHWENCDKSAGKMIRQFYRRPYFVPPMVEMSESNWLFLASKYKGKNHKPADLALPMMLLAQVKGDTKVMLTPRDPCKDTCSVLYGTVHTGEILVTTDMMWLLDYLPLSATETISIGFGGFFD